MPRAFSEREREAIRGQLQAAARESFRSTGVRRTNVDELARAAGISKGAFYLFYPSKEALLLELLLQLEDVFRGHFVDKIVAQPDQALRDLIAAALELPATEPLLERFASEDASQLMRGLPPDQVATLEHRDLTFVTDMLARLGEAGLTVRTDPTEVAGLLRGLFFLAMHRQQIGSDVFPSVANLLVDALARELVRPDPPPA